jgi:hypothetical protein
MPHRCRKPARPTNPLRAASGKEPQKPRFWTWRRAGAIIVGLATIAGAIGAILALHPF